jgi:cell division protein FtsL
VTQRAESHRLLINARLVKEKDRARARELRILLVYSALIVIPLLAYVWQRVDFIRRSYQVEALKKERQTLMETNRQLVVERSHLLAPDRIERVARRQLGLVDPFPDDVRRVRVIDGRIDDFGSRAAAPSPDGGARAGVAAVVGILPRPATGERR